MILKNFILSIVAGALLFATTPVFAQDMADVANVLWGVGQFTTDQEISTATGFYPAGEIEFPDGSRAPWVWGNFLTIPRGAVIHLDYGLVDVDEDLREVSFHVTSPSQPLIDSYYIEAKENVEGIHSGNVEWIYRNGEDPNASPYLRVDLDSSDWPTGIVRIFMVLTYSVPRPNIVAGLIPNGSDWVPESRPIDIWIVDSEEFTSENSLTSQRQTSSDLSGLLSLHSRETDLGSEGIYYVSGLESAELRSNELAHWFVNGSAQGENPGPLYLDPNQFSSIDVRVETSDGRTDQMTLISIGPRLERAESSVDMGVSADGGAYIRTHAVAVREGPAFVFCPFRAETPMPVMSNLSEYFPMGSTYQTNTFGQGYWVSNGPNQPFSPYCDPAGFPPAQPPVPPPPSAGWQPDIPAPPPVP